VIGFAVELGESNPQLPVQLRLHVTPMFCESYVTVAVNCLVWLTVTGALAGATDTEIGGGVVEEDL